MLWNRPDYFVNLEKIFVAIHFKYFEEAQIYDRFDIKIVLTIDNAHYQKG